MYVEIQEYGSPYIDEGASAYDAVDGYIDPVATYQLCAIPADLQEELSAVADDYAATWGMFDVTQLGCYRSVPGVDPAIAGNYSQGYLITYSVQNSRKQVSEPDYRLVVVTPRCPDPNRWCPNLTPPRCSVVGRCLNIAFADGVSFTGSDGLRVPSPPPAPQAVMSKQPPVITLLGSGVVQLLATGEVAMLTTVPWASKYADAGARATATPYGTQIDVTPLIQAFGVGSVDTSVPTLPGKPFSYIITYTVTDPVGNVAKSARRLVAVACPNSESYCIINSTGVPTCTVRGICGLDVSLAVGTTNGTTDLRSTSTAVAPTPPNITLNGPARIEIDQGAPYDFCTPSQTGTALCDRGASARDAQDGVITSLIRVCNSPTTKVPGDKKPMLPVSVACRFNTSVPGEYRVRFSATNSAGLTASVVRRVVVRVVCPVGQRRCADGRTCSLSGVCLSELQGTAAPAPPTPSAPLIRLRMQGAVTSDLVRVKRGSTYAMCNGTDPTDAQLCEPGAEAFDPNLPVAQQNITATIVACPRADCLVSNGCPPGDLRLMRMTLIGLNQCNLNLLAPVGSVFPVTFYAWTATIPPIVASVTRNIVITEPCEDQALPFFCLDNQGKFYCSAVSCANSGAFLLPPLSAPTLLLLPRNTSTVYVEFGATPPFSLAPCPSGTRSASVQSCGAVAYDRIIGTTNVSADLTPYVQVTTASYCDPATRRCSTCDVQQATLAGGCYQGIYNYTYFVSNSRGVVDTGLRTLVVYRASFVDLKGVTALPGLNNVTMARLVAGTINLGPTGGPNGTTTKEYKSAATAVAKKLSAFGVVDTDVDVSNATAVLRNVTSRLQVRALTDQPKCLVL